MFIFESCRDLNLLWNELEYNHLECRGNYYSPDNSRKWKEQFEVEISNKDGCWKAKELIMKLVYSVIYSVDSSARSENVRDITKIFEIKKAANQRLAAILDLAVHFSNLLLADLMIINRLSIL